MTFSDFDWRLLDRFVAEQNEAAGCLARLFAGDARPAIEEMRRLAERWMSEGDRPGVRAFDWFRLRHPADARALVRDMGLHVSELRGKAEAAGGFGADKALQAIAEGMSAEEWAGDVVLQWARQRKERRA